jgi:hypothetical protein
MVFRAEQIEVGIVLVGQETFSISCTQSLKAASIDHDVSASSKLVNEVFGYHLRFTLILQKKAKAS